MFKGDLEEPKFHQYTFSLIQFEKQAGEIILLLIFLLALNLADRYFSNLYKKKLYILPVFEEIHVLRGGHC